MGIKEFSPKILIVPYALIFHPQVEEYNSNVFYKKRRKKIAIPFQLQAYFKVEQNLQRQKIPNIAPAPKLDIYIYLTL